MSNFPPEVCLPTPRHVRWSPDLKWNVFVWVLCWTIPAFLIFRLFADARSQFGNEGVGALITALMLLFAGFANFYPLLRQRFLFRQGVPTQGRIVSAEKRRRGRGGVVALITYKFRNERGVEVEDRTYVSARYLKGPNAIDPVCASVWRAPVILVDPNNSFHSVLYTPDFLLRLGR